MTTLPSSLADEDLLAAFIPPTVVRELVEGYGSVQRLLANAYPEEMVRFTGIGPVKARQLQYVCELAKRLYRAKAELPPVIRCPGDVFGHAAFRAGTFQSNLPDIQKRRYRSTDY